MVTFPTKVKQLLICISFAIIRKTKQNKTDQKQEQNNMFINATYWFI